MTASRATGAEGPGRLVSCLATQARLETPAFQEWARRLGRAPGANRKTWEFAYIAQALAERGLLATGKRGLGFAVGREPLVALFASAGCELVATDQDALRAELMGYVASGDHAGGLADLAVDGLCDADALARKVTLRTVDMNRIPSDLEGFDFTWSACAFEHLGSIERGLAFVERMLDCLAPGGVGVHTTELNVSSDEDTLESGPTVLFRERDIRALAARLRGRGHAVTLDFGRGDGNADFAVAREPYPYSPHLKVLYGRHVTTSMGLIVEKRR